MALCNTGLHYRPRRSSTLHFVFQRNKIEEKEMYGYKGTIENGERGSGERGIKSTMGHQRLDTNRELILNAII